jgi:hypothetical protein
MNDTETAILEAIHNLFKDSKSKLGIIKGKPDKEISHRFEHQWNTIEYTYAMKSVDSPFHESITSAFHDIHSYKYLNDPTFPIALDKRLSAIAIPLKERKNAIKYLEETIKELGGENFEEKESGWHPDLDEIATMTREANNRDAKVTKPYTGGGDAPAKNETK